MKRRRVLTALFLLLAVCALALGIAAVRRAQRLPSSAGVRVPVLMYHAVGDDCWGEESLFVKPRRSWKSSCNTCPKTAMRRSFSRIFPTSSNMKSRCS